MSMKKSVKSVSHKVAKTAGNTAHAVCKFAGKNVTVGGLAVGAGLAAMSTGLAFRNGYALGLVTGSFGGHYREDD